ncbi:homeodomain-interacting protein kinase 1-like [Eucyclogobius newberryi]|uniref:homeodomain-interacting protein kinase 1-like n=1 Tax=Eucyclogobius newberryi TaxID=166745 RepID=UPI003B5B4CBD
MEEQKSVIPADKYKILQVLDKGAFGQVFKCQKKDTQEVVAIKVPLVYQDTEKEENFLKLLMAKYGDQNNIIKFYDSFKTPYGRAMIFECLEINLEDYLFDNMTDLRDIWSIIQQLATALVCLKKEGIIHGDLKFNNVMLVNKNKPLQVKLIDFGLAMYKSNVWKGRKMGIVEYR